MKTITIGRSSQCDIILSDQNISRIHAEISLANGQYVYHDCSSNGSNIGGQMICNRKIILVPGASVLLANKIPLPWDRVYALLPASGFRVNEAETHYQPQASTMYGCPPAHYRKAFHPANPDKLGIGWGILAFLIPIAGWIMYFVWKDETPNRANAAGIISIISFVIGLILYL